MLTKNAEIDRNLWTILIQGSLHSSAAQLGSMAIVIPFVTHELNWPAGIVSSYFPVFVTGAVAGSFFVPTLISFSVSLKALLLLSCGTQSISMFFIAGAINWHQLPLRPEITLTFALISGFASGVGATSWTLNVIDLLGASKIALAGIRQSGMGAAITLAVSVVSILFMTGGSGPTADIELLWIGAILMGVSAVFTLFIPRGSVIRIKNQCGAGRSFEAVRDLLLQNWSRKYLIAIIFLSFTILSVNFFSLYAAATNGIDGDYLDNMVFYANFGLLLGVLIWGKISIAYGRRAMLVGGVIFVAIASFLCLALQLIDEWPQIESLGVIFILSRLGGQVVNPGLQDWIAHELLVSDPAIIATIQSFSSIVSAVIGFAVGSLAQTGAPIWPITMFFTINIIGLFWTRMYRSPSR